MRAPAGLATALDNPAILARARRIRAAARHASDIAAEIDRLTARAQRQRSAAFRLPLRSNGRQRAQREAAECDALIAALAHIRQGRRVREMPAASVGRQAQRAADLLRTVVTESAAR